MVIENDLSRVLFLDMRKKGLVVSLFIIWSLLIGGTSAVAVVKPGSKCTKLGATSLAGGKKFTCIKTGKRLVWNKGVAVSPSTRPTPTASPTASSSPAPTPSAKPTVTPTPSPSPSAAPLITPSEISAYRNVSECKLVNESGNGDANQSHSVRSWNLVDTKKTIRILVFTVDFPDLVSFSASSPDFLALRYDFEDYYKSQSNDSMKFSWVIAPKVARMNKSVRSYGVGARAAGNVWELYNDMQDLALKTYKREDFDFFIGSAPTSTQREDIASSPAFGSRTKDRWPGTYLGGDYWSNGSSSSIPIHEFGHSGLGLADLYSFDASMLGAAGFEQQFKYMGVYDLMNWAGGAGLELTSWNRWIGGLIEDTQMLCAPDAPTITLLKPLQLKNNLTKGIVIPISKTSAIAIENRAAIGFDKDLPVGARGVIAYFVNTTIGSGYGPMEIIRKSGSKDVWFRDNALKVGETLTYKGYSIKVLGANGEDMYVEVRKVG